MARASDPRGAQQGKLTPLYIACAISTYAMGSGISALGGRVGRVVRNRQNFGIGRSKVPLNGVSAQIWFLKIASKWTLKIKIGLADCL